MDVIVGTWLSRSADILGEKTGLGRSWVGAILLAGATSLPELTTGISAVAVFNAPDLAAGISDVCVAFTLHCSVGGVAGIIGRSHCRSDRVGRKFHWSARALLWLWKKSSLLGRPSFPEVSVQR